MLEKIQTVTVYLTLQIVKVLLDRMELTEPMVLKGTEVHKENKVFKVYLEIEVHRENKESKEFKVTLDKMELMVHKEIEVHKVHKENKENKVFKVYLETEVLRENKESKV